MARKTSKDYQLVQCLYSKELIAEVDDFAKTLELNRTDILRAAIREYLKNNDGSEIVQ